MSGATKRAAAVPPRGRQSAYQIEKGLRGSMESVDNGLKQFLLSLKECGMVEGLQSYRAMQMVLVQQRLWAHSHGRTQLVPQFKSIAQTAGELHRIFAGYAEVMRPLKDLDRMSRVQSGAGPSADPPQSAPGEGDPGGEAAAPPAGDPAPTDEDATP